MKTIALRFGEHFAPSIGTIAAHQKLIDELGYVWYGKLGSAVSKKIIDSILDNETPRILLVSSGKAARFWAYVTEISATMPDYSQFPAYYHDRAETIKTWFKIVKFESAEKNIMAKCLVLSSGTTLTEASKHSMSPYFIIDLVDNQETSLGQ